MKRKWCWTPEWVKTDAANHQTEQSCFFSPPSQSGEKETSSQTQKWTRTVDFKHHFLSCFPNAPLCLCGGSDVGLVSLWVNKRVIYILMNVYERLMRRLEPALQLRLSLTGKEREFGPNCVIVSNTKQQQQRHLFHKQSVILFYFIFYDCVRDPRTLSVYINTKAVSPAL